jgi:hypothetical protein
MPNRWPISSGNWSNAAIWSGSIIPTASDDVYANNRIVNIDTNITVTTIRNDASASAIAAGGFFIPNDGVTITSNIFGNLNATSTATDFVIRCTGSNSSVIIGNVNTGAASFLAAISMNQGSSLTITGSVQCGIGGSPTTNRAILAASSGSLKILGNVLCGTAGLNLGTIHITSNPTIDISGEISSRTGTNPGPVLLVAGSPNINIIGNLVAGVSNCISITSGTPILTITGNINAGLSAAAIASTSTSIMKIIGPVYSSITFPGVQSSGTTAVNAFTGPFYNVNNRNAVYAVNLQLLSGSTTSWTFDTETNLEQRTLYTADFPGNFPSTSNVRQGTVFGNTGQFTGTVAIPVASNVLRGVPVSNTTGSASFNTQNVWSVSTSSLNASGSIGERLRNASTVATDGILITSKGTL